MGGKCPHRKVKNRRFSHKISRRSKFLSKSEEGSAKSLPIDEDLLGMGQFYCLHCDRYFASKAVRDEHFRTKRRKKRHMSTRRFAMYMTTKLKRMPTLKTLKRITTPHKIQAKSPPVPRRKFKWYYSTQELSKKSTCSNTFQ